MPASCFKKVEVTQQKMKCVILKRVARFSTEKSTDVKLNLLEVIQHRLRKSKKLFCVVANRDLKGISEIMDSRLKRVRAIQLLKVFVP